MQASPPQASLTTAPSSFLTYTPSVDLETTQSQPFTLCFSPVPSYVTEGSGACQRSPQQSWYSTCSFFLNTFP